MSDDGLGHNGLKSIYAREYSRAGMHDTHIFNHVIVCFTHNAKNCCLRHYLSVNYWMAIIDFYGASRLFVNTGWGEP